MKILDCTLRDGGYYTNWDFDVHVVDAYVSAMDKLPVEYLEIGYRNNPSSTYLGQFGYTPLSSIKAIRAGTQKKLSVMLNEKSTRLADAHALLKPISGYVDMVRLAVSPDNLDRAIALSKVVVGMGFEVSFNLMYMSKWVRDRRLLDGLCELCGAATLLCMVDSFGGITPSDVRHAFSEVRKVADIPLGFHGHNNLQLALINALTAIECGAEFVDTTVLGMGRGAGNLNLELLLTYLNRHNELEVDFNVLGDLVSAFSHLYEKYRWGTTLPYMISGANDIPQKVVMEWVANRVYSFNSVVRALDNCRSHSLDNARFPVFVPARKYASVVVVGGGPNAVAHMPALREYLVNRRDVALVFSTARNAAAYLDMPNDAYYCIVGNEGRRLMKNLGDKARSGQCILPPYPRKMGTEVPAVVSDKTFELNGIDFIEEYHDSVTAIALQLAGILTDGDVLLVGYDGYPGMVLSEKELSLTHENQQIFAAFSRHSGKVLKSLTPTLYNQLQSTSVYQYL